MSTGSGRHPDWQFLSKLFLVNGRVSSTLKEEETLPGERGEGWAETTLMAPILPLTCRGLVASVFVSSPVK